MNRTLVLMRHGKSGYPDGVADHERPLNDRGLREAALAGRWLQRDGIAVDAVLCSTATRTRETLERTGIDAPVQLVDDLYGGTPDDICESIRLNAPSDARTILVVAHFPGLPQTALVLDPSAQIDRFPTSAYAVLEVAAFWDRLGMSADDTSRMRMLRIPRT